jgi:hypothetical protein
VAGPPVHATVTRAIGMSRAEQRRRRGTSVLGRAERRRLTLSARAHVSQDSRWVGTGYCPTTRVRFSIPDRSASRSRHRRPGGSPGRVT